MISDIAELSIKSCFFTMGSMTFLEAYTRTGRILNVSVIPVRMADSGITLGSSKANRF
jgi:hypothetical protein